MGGWNSLCPTKTKATGDQFKTDMTKPNGFSKFFKAKWMESKERKHVTDRIHNLRCKSPAGQMATGKSEVEFTDMTRKLWGDFSNPPSYTERLFLSQDLYETCGNAMKDIRHRNDDHDPMFVRCNLPPL